VPLYPRTFEEGTKHAEPWEGAATNVAGLRVLAAAGDFLLSNAARDNKGTAGLVGDEQLLKAQRQLTSR
jgi:threonine synthase